MSVSFPTLSVHLLTRMKSELESHAASVQDFVSKVDISVK